MAVLAMIATSLYFDMYDSNTSGGNGVTTTTTATTYSDSTNSYSYYIYPDGLYWAPTSYPEYKDEFTPAHKVKNPFEYQIFDSIERKHGKFLMPKHKNITFKRQGFKGFI